MIRAQTAMKPRELAIEDGKRFLSPTFATLCGLVALALVLVAVVMGLGRRPAEQGVTIQKAGAIDAPYEDVRVKWVGQERWIFEQSDESDLERYTTEAVIRRLEVIRTKDNPVPGVTLLVSQGTSAGEITTTLDELRAAGVESMQIVDYDRVSHGQ